MRGAIPPLPNTPSWRCAQEKHRDNFTFILCDLTWCLIKHRNNFTFTLHTCSLFPALFSSVVWIVKLGGFRSCSEAAQCSCRCLNEYHRSWNSRQYSQHILDSITVRVGLAYLCLLSAYFLCFRVSVAFVSMLWLFSTHSSVSCRTTWLVH
jgi:ABC-type spermidine/putrescine transport system permease subunit I